MPLTPSESQELQRLLAKAKSKSGPPSETSDVSGVYDPDTGLFMNPLTGEVCDVWTIAEHEGSEVLGAMTDGAKRREEMPLARETKRIMVPQAKAYGGPASSQGVVPGSMHQPMSMGAPFPGMSPACGPEIGHANLPPLPEGVPDVDTWSYTLIEFGQFKGASMSYQELVDSTEERHVSYIKWCRSRSRTASGQLKDLCDFLAHHYANTIEDSGPVIPGTGVTRRLKK
eukprot:s2757_g10.t1